MRSRKCQDKDRCTYAMIGAAKYKKREKSQKTLEEQQAAEAAASLRIKADYDKVVDAEVLYEDCKQKSPFVDDGHQAHTLVLFVVYTCESNRLCSGYYYVPGGYP